MEQNQGSVCSGEDYVRFATRLSTLALDVGHLSDAKAYFTSEVLLCADFISGQNLLRAETLIAEGRFRAGQGDYYHSEYAMRRAETILDKLRVSEWQEPAHGPSTCVRRPVIVGRTIYSCKGGVVKICCVGRF